MRSSSIIFLFISAFFVLIWHGCKTCIAPTITLDPEVAAIDKNPGQGFAVNIIVTGKDKISSIMVSKSLNGGPKTSFMIVAGIGTQNKTVSLVDTVPNSMAFGSVITYTISAISECKKAVAAFKTITVTVIPSSVILSDLVYLVENNLAPRIYSRYSVNLNNNRAYHLVAMPSDGRRFTADPNIEKDIMDSIILSNPFNSSTVRWGSRNGSKFVKAPSFDWANASAKSIVDAYNAGTPSDLINFAVGDFIIVNIKNENRYAVIKVKQIIDDGVASTEDYSLFAYKVTHL